MITKLLSKLKDKTRRELFVAGQIKTGIPFQIRALRDKYGWTQADLGERLGMTQTNISRLESPGYGKLNITTLQRLAAAFDVALVVRFVPFSHLIKWADDLSPEEMAPKSFAEELESLERIAALTNTTVSTQISPVFRMVIGDPSQAVAGFTPMQWRSIASAPFGIVDSTQVAEAMPMEFMQQSPREEESLEEFPETLIPTSTVVDFKNTLPF